MNDDGILGEEGSFARTLKSVGIQMYVDTHIRVGNYKQFII